MSAAENKAVFLSYASQDAEAARNICDALRVAGVEVWFDQSELRGGDAWDQKIRRQIKECALFIPIISTNTQARAEGYFRLEWRLADQRTHLMGKSKAFLVPVSIDATRDTDADVPDSFVAVQWTRLPAGEAPARFCTRVQNLLGNESAPIAAGVADPTPVSASRPGSRQAKPANTKRTPWLVPTMIGATVIAALALWQPWREKSAPASTPAGAIVGPQAEAAQLAERARNRVVQSRDQLQVAIEMARHATDLADDSARAWAVRARLESLFILRGWDVSEQRRQEAQTLAKRALALDPNATDAMLALAVVLQGQGAYAEVEALMRRAIALAPDDALLRLALGDALSAQGKEADALAVREETLRRFPKDSLAHYNLALSYEHAPTPNFDAAMRAFDDSIALQPYATTILHKVSLLAGWKGDLPTARQLLDDLDPLERTGDRAVGIAMMIGLLEHHPARTIEAGGRTTRTYLEDAYVRGPKAWSLAHAYAMDGKPSLAQAQWRIVESVLRERVRATPDDWFNQAGLGVTLAWLGARDEATRIMAPLGSVARESPQSLRTLYLAYYHAGLGDAPGAVEWLQRILDRRELVTSKTLPFDPWWDKVRGAPEFQTLLATAEDRLARTTPRRDWPRDPDLKRAIGLLDGFDAIPEDFRLAEEIAQRALDKSPTDPETATVMARVQSMWLLRSWDSSVERFRKAKSTIERAAQLAPDDPEALAALGLYVFGAGVRREAELQRAEQLFRRAIELAPSEPRFYRNLDLALSRDRTVPDQARFASAEHVAALFPADALAHYDLSIYYRDAGRLAEFEKETDATIALAPVANAIVWKARAEFFLHDNLAAMKAQLDRVPPRVRNIERTVTTWFLYAAFSGQLQEGLDVLRGFPEPWMTDSGLDAPTAMFTGTLLELAGKPELARLQFEAALAEVKRHESAEPANARLRMPEAWCLAGLGRDAEARAAYRIYNETITRPFRVDPLTFWWFGSIQWNLLHGERSTALQFIREAAETSDSRGTIRQRMKFDPWMVPFRADPEITALLVEPSDKKP